MSIVLFASLLALAGCAHTHVAGSPVMPGTTPQCTIAEVSRGKLLDPRGRQVYIQPVVAVPNRRGELLLAGERNYVFGREGGGQWTRATEDSLLGAIVPTAGPAQLVRSPIPTQFLGSVRAVARDDGTWSVVFAELKHAGAERSDSVARLWYGVLDGSRWATLEVIPVPPHGSIRRVGASAPVETSDLFSWAVILSTAEHPGDVLVLQRKQGRWSHEVVPTVFASYAAIAYPPGSEPLLAVVQPDLELPSDGNSLFLWTRQPSWTRAAKLVASQEEAVHDPRVDFSGTTGTLSWLGDRGRNGQHARTMGGTPYGFAGPIVTLDLAVARGSRQSTVTLRDVGRVWVLDHRGQNGLSHEIRFVGRSGDQAMALGTLTHAFLGAFVAASPRLAEIILAGGVQDSPGSAVATLVIRTRVRCLARFRWR